MHVVLCYMTLVKKKTHILNFNKNILYMIALHSKSLLCATFMKSYILMYN